MKPRSMAWAHAILCTLPLFLGLAHAEGETAPDPTWVAAMRATVHGPSTVAFKDQAQFSVPEGYGFVPLAQAKALMEKMGNQTDERFVGLILPLSDEDHWFMSVDYDAAGYVKDEEAKDWDAEALFENLQEGTKKGNEHRKSVGVPPIEITRWIQKPDYNAGNHRLVWSIELREIGKAGPNPTINYNTYLLGREGYIEMDLITEAATVEHDKVAARKMLEAVNFNAGKRYGDFNASTDKVAAYGIAALVGGIAAKKLGLLALAGAFFAKFFKVIIVAAVAGAGALKKFFGGRAKQA